MKKVFIDLHYLKNLNKGFGQFSLHLSLAILKQKSDLDFIFYIPNQKHIKDIFMPYGVETKYYASYHRYTGISSKSYVFHSTNQLSKFTPRSKNTPLIVTFHDINFIFEKPINKDLKLQIQNKINRAQSLVFISNFTKDIVNKNFNISSQIIQKVIYNGNNLFNIKPKKNKDIKFSYLFTLTEIRPYKNIDKLIKMMRYLPTNLKLIIAGKSKKTDQDCLNELVKKNNLKDRVIFKGVVSEEEKVELYSNCKAFVFASSREGFGLPVVEALNFNIPIFLTNLTSLPEIGGDACFYWDKLEPKYMALIVTNGFAAFNANQNEYILKIKNQLSKFSWDSAAQQYIKLYKQLIKN